MASTAEASIFYHCACCRVWVDEWATWRTYDGRTWCAEHGPVAIRLEREAHDRGEDTFTMPGPVALEVRARIARNNRRRFGP